MYSSGQPASGASCGSVVGGAAWTGRVLRGGQCARSRVPVQLNPKWLRRSRRRIPGFAGGAAGTALLRCSILRSLRQGLRLRAEHARPVLLRCSICVRRCRPAGTPDLLCFCRETKTAGAAAAPLLPVLQRCPISLPTPTYQRAAGCRVRLPAGTVLLWCPIFLSAAPSTRRPASNPARNLTPRDRSVPGSRRQHSRVSRPLPFPLQYPGGSSAR